MTTKAVVLIVDDTPDNIQVLAGCLKSDYQLKVATSGQRCLELVRSACKPDLILLDVMMPGLSGHEVIEQLKADRETASIPVIFITGRDEEAEEELGLALGAVDYITKPIRPSIVKARVKTHVTLKQQRDQLATLAMCDQLTGLYNRHYLTEVANKKLSQALRHRQPLSLLFLDVDHFKSINDQLGHKAGDHILKAIASALVDNCRHEDLVARFGGEEFIIMLDQCDLTQARLKAEQIRRAIERLTTDHQSITISIGVAVLDRHGESLDNLLKRADMAMYQAKQQGRNRVVVSRYSLDNLQG